MKKMVIRMAFFGAVVAAPTAFGRVGTCEIDGNYFNWVESDDKMSVSLTLVVDTGSTYSESLVVPSQITLPAYYHEASRVDNVTSFTISTDYPKDRIHAITIPSTVQTLSGLNGMVNLESVQLSAGLKHIGSLTFSGCIKLVSLTLPEGLETIGGNAFLNCSKLLSLSIPSSVLSIGESAFNGCSGLSRIDFNSDLSSDIVASDVLNLSHCAIYFPEASKDCWFSALKKNGVVSNRTSVEIVSSKMRINDPTIMDVVYKPFRRFNVARAAPDVKVRALAFQDGERSFWKVVRATEFVNDPDGNPTAQNIGDNIQANVEHELAWKVSKDWKTDLAKVKFEVLCSDQAQLLLKLNHIKAVGKYPALTIGVGTQADADIFNALLWWYADGDEHLVNTDGYVDAVGVDCVGSSRWVDRTVISGERMDIEKWLYSKMGYEPLVGGDLLSYVRTATRKELWWNSSTRNCVVKTDTKPTELYVGEKAYWAVDLITGAEEYLDSVPLAGWGDEYKTTKLLFRRIEPGLVTVGGTKPVTLTRPFYMGVFEVTQKQYELIVGSNPSSYKGDMRPVDYIGFNDIRGTAKGAQWPSGTEFDEESFLGKLKAKVGISFDLPTEAQWEYACRAGTSSYFNNGASSLRDLILLGRYESNCTDGRGGYSEHTTVGSYLPNAWGLYDMHGNVYEWCLDWYEGLNSDPATDWVGADSGVGRIRRGGFFHYNGFNFGCGSSYRYSSNPSSRYYDFGFRLIRALAQ